MLEVNLGLLKKNYFQLKREAGSAELMVLLKSDAYGHSHEQIALALDSLPKDSKLHGFAVANVEEGIELRRLKVKRPVYVLSGIQQVDEDILRCIEICRLTPVISSLSVLKEFDTLLRRKKKSLSFHLKINTGMNRLGVDMHELDAAIDILKANPKLLMAGLMSHFASAERKGSALTALQLRNFRAAVAKFREREILYRWLHMENSAGLMNHCLPEGNLARVGLNLYGVGHPKLQPVATWTAQVYQIRNLKRGDSVGYGPLFKAKKSMRMAVLGVGYGDGYHRAFSNKADVLIHGKRCRVIGAVSMDLTAVDVSHVPGIGTASRAVLMGRDGRDFISAEELSRHAGCIPWEILTGISPRVPRVFVNE